MYSHSPTVTMNAIRLLLVSTILFYNEINGPLTGSASSSTSNSPYRTVLKPYMSIYDKHFKVSSNGTKKNKSRNVLNVTVKKTLSAQFTPDSWAMINTKEYTDKENVENLIGNYNKVYEFHYHFLSYLFLRIEKWLQLQIPKKDNIVEYYFGLEKEAVNLSNNSLTALMAQERNQNGCMKHHVSFFYYLLDLKHAEPYNISGRCQIISDKIKQFYDVSKERVRSYVGVKEKSVLKEYLSSNVPLIDNKASPLFGFTIPAMKLWLLIDPPANDNLPMKNIQKLKPNASDQRTVSDYVRLYSHEINVFKVNDYHVGILSVLITHLFRYVHNHFTLLLKLKSYRIEKDDRPTIVEFKEFMNGYVSVFIDRYFEFKGEISQEIVDAMFPIMFFLDPSDPQYVDNNDFTENEKKFLKEHKKPKISISDYYEQSLEETELEQEMKTLIDKAVDVLIKSFTDENSPRRIVTAWNSELNRKLNVKGENKSNLLILLKKNNMDALSLLDEFSRVFTV